MKFKLLLILSLVILGVMWWMVRRTEVRVVFCDVGQGDGAIVIDGNFQMLIDVGPDNGKMQRCLGKYVPFWDKEIEVAVISHTDSDHSGGLESIKRGYRVQKVYSAELRQNDTIRYDRIDFEVLSPPAYAEATAGKDDNRDSVVGLLKYKEKRLLFLADVPIGVDQRLVWRGILTEPDLVDILKVSHHGSREGTSRELLELVKPKLAVISVGKNNKYGHPNEELLERLGGIEIWRMDERGDLMVGLD